MKYLLMVTASLFVWVQAVNAQAKSDVVSENPNVRMGQKALLDGNFKAASTYLEKALPKEGNDPNVLYMLGYAQYHSGEYEKALTSFTKVVTMRPEDERSYYYRGRLNNILGTQSGSKLTLDKRRLLLQQAIEDFSKGINLNEEDAKLFQNRGVAYRDLGILLGTSGSDIYDKSAATDAYNQSIADFERVLQFFPGRKDIETEIKKAKVYRDNLK